MCWLALEDLNRKYSIVKTSINIIEERIKIIGSFCKINQNQRTNNSQVSIRMMIDYGAFSSLLAMLKKKVMYIKL